MTSIEIATSIIKKLFDEGYIAYFAGGWVRDYLLNIPSHEIDIATSAPPEKILELFPKALPIGIAFGVVIVIIDGINFEVTTFRKDHPYYDGRHPDGVDYSTPEKDAQRRDFTINGMFYDPLTKTLLDYVGGQKDLERKIIRAIGDPSTRFTEDKLRMLRAIRFAYRLRFSIEKETEKAILKLSSTLFPAVSIERVWQEFTKMAKYPHFNEALLTMHRLNLLPTIFPALQGVSLKELEKRTSYIPYFPLNCPTILFLLELFPDVLLDEYIELCHFLKTTKEDIKLVKFVFHAKTLLAQHNISLHEWASFYADSHADLFLEVEGSKILPPEKKSFFLKHKERQIYLHFHIENIKNRTPVLTSSHLKQAGIEPSPLMGQLLKEGEKISVDHDIRDPLKILTHLQNSPLWPKT